MGGTYLIFTKHGEKLYKSEDHDHTFILNVRSVILVEHIHQNLHEEELEYKQLTLNKRRHTNLIFFIHVLDQIQHDTNVNLSSSFVYLFTARLLYFVEIPKI